MKGTELFQYRVSRRLTRQELADRVGCTHASIARWESIHTVPDKYVNLLAKIFKEVDTEYLRRAFPSMPEKVIQDLIENNTYPTMRVNHLPVRAIKTPGEKVSNGVGRPKEYDYDESELFPFVEGEVRKKPEDISLEAVMSALVSADILDRKEPLPDHLDLNETGTLIKLGVI